MEANFDIYIGEESTDHFDIDDLAALYNCKVVSRNSEYVTLAGKPEELDEFSHFWANHISETDVGGFDGYY